MLLGCSALDKEEVIEFEEIELEVIQADLSAELDHKVGPDLKDDQLV